jgi:peptidoglycan/LPS O-acetylase OafA/YrhL
LITELLERETEATGAVRLGAFYVRRILRIWPLYFAVLLLDFGYMRVWRPGVFTTEQLLAFALLAGNWFVAHHGWIGALSVPLWSISVEEQFYLVWPSVYRGLRRTGAIVFALVALGASYAAVVALCRQGINLDISLWVNSFLQFQFFATGALLALWLRERMPAFRTWQRLLLLGGGLLGFYLAQVIFHAKAGMLFAEAALVVPGYLLVNAGCVVIFLAFYGFRALQGARRLAAMGKISYGLYVFHWGVLVFWRDVLQMLQRREPAIGGAVPTLQFCLALGTTVCLAAGSYRFFERPLLRFKQRYEVIRTLPV